MNLRDKLIEALYLFRVQRLCYSADPVSFAALGIEQISKFEDRKTDTQVCIFRQISTGRIIVAWPGTSSWKDIITDADQFHKIPFTLGAYTVGEVGHGFNTAFMSVEHLVLYEVKRIMGAEPGTRFESVGYSLGSALAGQCGLAIRQETANVGVWQFEGPRWADVTLAAQFDQDITESVRIVNESDIVTTVPFRIMGYKHTKGKIWLTGGKAVEILNTPAQERRRYWLKSILESWWFMPNPAKIWRAVENHFSENAIANLEGVIAHAVETS